MRQHQVGRIVQGETGFYTRQDDKTVRAADVAFISFDTLSASDSNPGYGTVPPELVVEVVSPSDRAEKIEEKVQEWLRFGVRVIWVVYPKTKHVHVHTAHQIQVLNTKDTIQGEPALPGFTSPVRAFFED